MNTVATETELVFNYASLALTPYVGSNETNTQLLKKIISCLNDDKFPKGDKVVNRHKKQTGSGKRELVMLSNLVTDRGVRCNGKIALIKNKAPWLWHRGDDVIEIISKPENKQFIEITNYLIHFDPVGSPIIMYEFNNDGPRLSDIEFYLRHIAREHRIAKFVNCKVHLKIEYDQLESQMRNVFGINVKVKSPFANRINWLSTLQNLNNETGYKDVRLEFLYRMEKDAKGNYIKNIRGTEFARNLISWLRRDRGNIKYIDDLKMKYQCEDGQVLELDFMKNKQESNIKLPLTDGSSYSQKELKDALGEELNNYLRTGKTNTD